MSRLAELRAQMAEAAAALDFATAARLRDEISLLAGAADSAATADPAGLQRQQPGAMGLGTGRQQVEPPPGWTPPPRPDPMTRGRSRRRG